MSQREPLPPCCHALSPGRKCSSKANFASELAKFAVSAKADGVQRLASDLSAARSALQLDGSSSPSSMFQSADDIPAYSQKLAAYLALVKGFTAAANADKELQPADASVDATTGGALRQPLVEVGDGAAVAAAGAESRRSALPADCSGCLNFCRWQDALTGQTVYARSARQEYAHVLLAAAILMMTEARDKVDAIVAERLAELSETQLKLAYQLLLHAAGVLEACLESMDVAPRAIGAAFADLAQKEEPQTQTEVGGDVGAVPDDDTMAKWREEQRQIQQMTTQQAAPDTTASSRQAKPVASAAAEDLAMLTRVPDLAGGRFPQLQAWIALAEAQELVVLRGVTREVVDFSLMAKLSTDISARYRECQKLASRLLPYSSSLTAERIRLYCAYKEPYYQAIAVYFQGAACMLKEDARNCVQAVADFKKAAALLNEVVPLEKSYEAKMAADKQEKERVVLLAAVFLRSQQVIRRDLDIVAHRNDSVYYEPIPEPEAACDALSLVKPTSFAAVKASDLWRDGEVASCLKPTAVVASGAAAEPQQQQSSRPKEGCCSSCIVM